MQQLGVLKSHLLLRALEDVVVHLLDAILLLMPRLVPACLVGVPILLEREEAEDVDVLTRQVPIPRPGTAAGDDDDPASFQLESAERPVQERDPVEQLETDLTDPWPDDQWACRRLQSLELASDGRDSLRGGDSGEFRL